MTRLTLLYDARCTACARFRRWLGGQPAHVSLRFVGFRTGEAHRAFPTLDSGPTGHADLLVVGDHGEVWRGDKAWRMCLWALREHRRHCLSPAYALTARHEHDAAYADLGSVARPQPAPVAVAPSPAVRPSNYLPPALSVLALVLVGLAAASSDGRGAFALALVILYVVGLCAVLRGLVLLAAWLLCGAVRVCTGKG